MRLRLVASAKVNLTLEALGRRDDGYHEIAGVFQTLALRDTVVLSPAASIELHTSGPTAGDLDVAADRNLAYRAALALREEARNPSLGAFIDLEKVVPAAAGLGGGSSDAAAVLRGLNRLWALDFDAARLQRVAATLGSDVAFFLTGGTALARGRGDEVAPMAGIAALQVAVAVPRVRIERKTAQMYSRLRPEHYTSGEHTKRLVEKIASRGAVSDDDAFNVFEAVVGDAMPAAAALMDEVRRLGARPHLAGSGPAFYFLSPLSLEAREHLSRAGVALFETRAATARESTAWEEA